MASKPLSGVLPKPRAQGAAVQKDTVRKRKRAGVRKMSKRGREKKSSRTLEG